MTASSLSTELPSARSCSTRPWYTLGTRLRPTGRLAHARAAPPLTPRRSSPLRRPLAPSTLSSWSVGLLPTARRPKGVSRRGRSSASPANAPPVSCRRRRRRARARGTGRVRSRRSRRAARRMPKWSGSRLCSRAARRGSGWCATTTEGSKIWCHGTRLGRGASHARSPTSLTSRAFLLYRYPDRLRTSSVSSRRAAGRRR